MMEMLHLEVHACTTMDDAIEWFTATADAGAPPDIVFMDMQLADPHRVRVRVRRGSVFGAVCACTRMLLLVRVCVHVRVCWTQCVWRRACACL